MADDQLIFNGIDGETGEYLTPPISLLQTKEILRGARRDKDHLSDLADRKVNQTAKHYGVRVGIDPKKLGEAGWGVLFAKDADPTIYEAISLLLKHRRKEASAIKEIRYKEYIGDKGYL